MQYSIAMDNHYGALDKNVLSRSHFIDYSFWVHDQPLGAFLSAMQKSAFQCSLAPIPLLESPPTLEHTVQTTQDWEDILALQLTSCVTLDK